MNKNLFTLERDHKNKLRKSENIEYDIKRTDFWTIKKNESLMSMKPRGNIDLFNPGQSTGGDKHLKSGVNNKYRDLY